MLLNFPPLANVSYILGNTTQANDLRPSLIKRLLSYDHLPWLVLMFSLTCTGIAWLSTQKFADEAENSHLELKVNAAVNDISQRMQLYDEVLLGAA